jgi:pimeloyl-ACP methyl ester carboxylesterase
MKSKNYTRLLACLFVLLLTLTFTGCQKEADTAQPAGSVVTVDSVASADGVMIRYDTRGAGDKTLVFVHCWCCNRTFWDNKVTEFARDYRVVTIDLAGHGESGEGREVWTIAAFGADVAAVFEKLDLTNAVLIGHSMGGPVCIEAARLVGDRAIGLVGVDNLQNMTRTFTPEQVEGFVGNFESDFPGYTREFVGAMFTPVADSALKAGIIEQMAAEDPRMGMEAIGNTVTYDYAAALADMRLPIRTIASDRYPTDVAGNRALASSFEVRLMPGQGHFPHLENPPMFNQLLHETLADFWPVEATE